jgi:hypothetical protein
MPPFLFQSVIKTEKGTTSGMLCHLKTMHTDVYVAAMTAGEDSFADDPPAADSLLADSKRMLSMPVILVNRVVDTKRIIEKNGGPSGSAETSGINFDDFSPNNDIFYAFVKKVYA